MPTAALSLHQQSVYQCTWQCNVRMQAMSMLLPLLLLLLLPPLLLLLLLLQVVHSTYAGVWDCIDQVYKAEGLAAFYRSYRTTLIMNVPYIAMHFRWVGVQQQPEQ